MVKTLLCNARDTGSIHGQDTKILDPAEQLNPSTTTAEPVHHNWTIYLLQPKIPHYTAKTLHVTTKTKYSQINK